MAQVHRKCSTGRAAATNILIKISRKAIRWYAQLLTKNLFSNQIRFKKFKILDQIFRRRSRHRSRRRRRRRRRRYGQLKNQEVSLRIYAPECVIVDLRGSADDLALIVSAEFYENENSTELTL